MQGMWWEFAKAYEASNAWTCWSGHGAAVRKELDRAQRFFLPAGVDLSVGKRYEDVRDLLRLPFPTIALMSDTYVNEEWGPGRGERVQTLTIAVSAEHEDSPAFSYLPAKQWPQGQAPWMMLIPLARAPKIGLWVPDGPAVFVMKAEAASGLALNMHAADTPFTQDLMRSGMPPERLVSELRDNLKCVVELCLLLGLQNVRSVRQPAPKGAAKQRERKRKSPLFDYHVLEVDGDLWDRSAAVQQATGQGVRSHLRRGHIRRLSDSRRVWVRACYVHGSAPGFAAKDYAVASNAD